MGRGREQNSNAAGSHSAQSKPGRNGPDIHDKISDYQRAKPVLAGTKSSSV
jgi:hypothetical protein